MAKNHKLFQPLRMASEDVASYNRDVVLAADADNGSLLIETVPATNIFGAQELNAYVATAPAAVATDTIVVLDANDVPEIEGFRIDVVNPHWQYLKAGTVGRGRLLVVGDEFAVSADWFESVPTVGQFAIPANGKMNYTPSATLGTTRVAFKVEGTHTFSIGRTYTEGYRLKVVKA